MSYIYNESYVKRRMGIDRSIRTREELVKYIDSLMEEVEIFEVGTEDVLGMWVIPLSDKKLKAPLEDLKKHISYKSEKFTDLVREYIDSRIIKYLEPSFLGSVEQRVDRLLLGLRGLKSILNHDQEIAFTKPDKYI